MARERKTTDGERKGGGVVTRQERLSALVTDLRGRYPNRIFTGEDYTMPWAIRRLPFGIPDLDIATNGGAPGGGFTMIVGKPSEGKNYLVNRVVRGQQRLYGADCAVAMIGTELVYDKSQGRAAGVKVALSTDEIDAVNDRYQRLYRRGLTKDEVADLKTQIGTFLIIPPTTAEEAFDVAVELVASGEFNVVALDSFGSILTEDDDDKDFTENARVGGASGLNTRLMRKMNSAFAPLKDGRPNLTCFMGINQVRDKLNAKPNEKQTHEGGGWSLKHGRFLTIELARTEYIRNELTKRKIAKRISWEITKQKAGGYEGHSGNYVYVMGDCEIDMGELLLRLGQEYDLIEKTGNTYTYCGMKLGVGEKNAAAALVKHSLADEIHEAILAAAKVTLVT
jgi:RecA/RadA recombinase